MKTNGIPVITLLIPMPNAKNPTLYRMLLFGFTSMINPKAMSAQYPANLQSVMMYPGVVSTYAPRAIIGNARIRDQFSLTQDDGDSMFDKCT